MRRNTIIALAIIVIVVAAGAGAWYLSGSPKTYPGAPEELTIGTAPVELAGLIYIADDQRYFQGNGLSVRIREYDSALSAVAGMERGETDLSVSTEYPIVAEAFASRNISIVGSIDKYQTTYLVGMKDRGIGKSSDFAGKTIGVTRRSIGEFYLGQFLMLNGISLKNVTLTDIRPAQVQGALANRSIDAAIIWNIDPETIEDRFGDTVVVVPAQGQQPTFGVLAGRDERIAGRPAATGRFISSLEEAERYVVDQPAAAREIVRRRVNATDAHMAAAWPRHQFSLTLDQSLITAMEYEARWMIASNLTNATAVPDFRRYVNTRGLEGVKPGAVRIIG